MDLQMPVLDGFAAGKIIRSDPDLKDIKMIALTSFAMVDDRERILGAGSDHYLAKPLDTQGLIALVAATLKR